MPGYTSNDTYTDEFLDFISPFQTLRFMKPLQAEDNPIVEWEDRTLVDHYAYFMDIEDTIRPGLPVEIMIDIANSYNKHIWLNIPYMANDACVDSFATLLLNELEDDVTIYVEYTNEAWNPDYPHTYDYMVEQGDALGYTGTDFQKNNYYYTHRSIEVFEIFDCVFAGSTARVQTVFCSQAWDFTAGLIRDAYADSEVNPNNYKADYFSIAPYFGNELIMNIEAAEGDICGWEIDDFMDTLEMIFIPELDELIRGPKAVADDMGLPMVAYEAGHGIGQFRELSDCGAEICSLANMHPKMGDLYCTYFQYWQDSVGSGVINSFVAAEGAGQYGSYGIVESVLQDPEDSPKWLAHRDCGGINTSSERTEIEDIEKNELVNYLGDNSFYINTETNFEVYDLLGHEILSGKGKNTISLD